MHIAEWSSLEVAKLLAAIATPIVVLFLGLGVNRSLRRLEQAQWASRKLIERRLEVFDAMAGPLNDLFSFFKLVGDFQRITPPDAIARKRDLDRIFHTNRVLMTEDFEHAYNGFMSACFRTYAALGKDAELRAGLARQRAERGSRWKAEWTRCFVDDDALVSSLSELSHHYNALLECFARELGVRRSASERRTYPVRRGAASPSASKAAAIRGS